MVHCKRPRFKLYPKFVVTHLNRSKSQYFQYVLPENLELFVFRLFQLNRPTDFYSSNPPLFEISIGDSVYKVYLVGIKLIYGRS